MNGAAAGRPRDSRPPRPGGRCPGSSRTSGNERQPFFLIGASEEDIQVIREAETTFIRSSNGAALSRRNRTRHCSTHNAGAAVPAGWSAT